MIDEVVADMASQLVATLPWVKAVKHIARQDPTGIILLELPEEYAGIDDRHDGKAYVRFRDGWDVGYADASLTSAPDARSIARLRAVLMHYCTNEHDIARYFSFGILNCVNHSLRYSVRLLNHSTDKQFIIPAETKNKPGWPENHLRLCMVDFDVTYRDSLMVEPACVPACDGC